VTRLWRKRLSWIASLAAFPVNAVMGDRHYDKYGGHPWKKDPADVLDALVREVKRDAKRSYR
jgi:hypothetical protein